MNYSNLRNIRSKENLINFDKIKTLNDNNNITHVLYMHILYGVGLQSALIAEQLLCSLYFFPRRA